MHNWYWKIATPWQSSIVGCSRDIETWFRGQSLIRSQPDWFSPYFKRRNWRCVFAPRQLHARRVLEICLDLSWTRVFMVQITAMGIQFLFHSNFKLWKYHSGLWACQMIEQGIKKPCISEKCAFHKCRNNEIVQQYGIVWSGRTVDFFWWLPLRNGTRPDAAYFMHLQTHKIFWKLQNRPASFQVDSNLHLVQPRLC